jgi:hypothetical protein
MGWPGKFFWVGDFQYNFFCKLQIQSLLFPDIIGYGSSDKPENIFAYSVKKLTTDLVGILDYLVENTAHVVVRDWGAPISWYTSLLYHERILSVSGLSVPHSFLGSNIKPTEMHQYPYKKNFFYILYFQEEGVAEKEFEKNIKNSLRLIFSISDYQGMLKNIETMINQKKFKGEGLFRWNEKF